MAYTKQTFVNNSTVLTAEHLQHIENGIEEVALSVDNMKKNGYEEIANAVLELIPIYDGEAVEE